MIDEQTMDKQLEIKHQSYKTLVKKLAADNKKLYDYLIGPAKLITCKENHIQVVFKSEVTQSKRKSQRTAHP